MAVMLETSRGDLVVDLFTEECPITSKNFLKLCKLKYYNKVLFHNIQTNFIVQTGDPTGTGKGGDSVYGLMYGEQARFFQDEIRQDLKHKKKGMVAMASGSEGTNASQFYITTGLELDSLDGKHTIFGEVSEGLDVLQQINDAFVDDAGRPLQNIRIRHTHVLDDPFDDPPQLATLIPESSPEPTFEHGDRLEDDWKPDQDTRAPEVIEEEIRKSEAKNRAVVLEMIGDLPEADSKPPSNMLFIAKLNQVTTEEDLETIFGRFGNITSCDIIRDKKTGDSLCYAFLGYDTDEACENAYFKMNNVLIDDRRIKVDFSQSVYHLWKQFRRFGRDGGAPDPSQPGMGPPGAVGGHDRLQLKMAGQSAQRGQPKQQYNLVMGNDSPERRPQQASRQQDRPPKHHKQERRDFRQGDQSDRQPRKSSPQRPTESRHRAHDSEKPLTKDSHRHKRHKPFDQHASEADRRADGRQEQERDNSRIHKSRHDRDRHDRDRHDRDRHDRDRHDRDRHDVGQTSSKHRHVSSHEQEEKYSRHGQDRDRYSEDQDRQSSEKHSDRQRH